MRKILSTIAIVAASAAFAQVGISGNTADTPQATLDVRAITATGTTAEGVLIPRVTKQKAQDMAANSQKSALIWVVDGAASSATGGAVDNFVDADGFYYFDGTEWVKLGGAAAPSVSARAASTSSALTDADLNGYILVTGNGFTFDLDDLNPSDGSVINFANFNNFAGFSVISSSGKIAPGSATSLAVPGAGVSYVYDKETNLWYSIQTY